MIAGARLALGLLTVLPMGRVETDRRTVRTALLLAPAVGLLVGGLAWAVGALLSAGDAGSLVAAVSAVGVLAVVTRALHLDGLADVADGLGSARPPEQALEVMRRSDVGPFGVATLVLVLLLQIALLAEGFERDLAAPMLLLGCLTGRLSLLWACRPGVPAARPDGLGALVAGVVPVLATTVTTTAACLGAAVWGWYLDGRALAFVAAIVVGIAAGNLLLRRARRRLGGVTGDVLGAGVEVATTAALLTLLLVA